MFFTTFQFQSFFAPVKQVGQIPLQSFRALFKVNRLRNRHLYIPAGTSFGSKSGNAKQGVRVKCLQGGENFSIAMIAIGTGQRFFINIDNLPIDTNLVLFVTCCTPHYHLLMFKGNPLSSSSSAGRLEEASPSDLNTDG